MEFKSSCLRVAAAACAWLFACGLATAQPVTIARDTALHAEPNPGAPAIAQLKQGDKAEQIGRQGAWVNVQSGSAAGWLYSFNVTYPAGPAPAGGAVAPGRRAITATIGIRGLEAEDLRRATLDSRQLELLDAYAASRQEAEAAAKRSGLIE